MSTFFGIYDTIFLIVGVGLQKSCWSRSRSFSECKESDFFNPTPQPGVKSLISLLFVPEGEILDKFFELADNFVSLDRVEELITYFEVTSIQGRDRGQGRGRVPPRYPHEMWNHLNSPRNNVPRTTSAVEGYQMCCELSLSIPTSASFLKYCKETSLFIVKPLLMMQLLIIHLLCKNTSLYP